MSKINAEQIKELRNLTQAGMAACKDALVEADGDMNKAVDIVKAKGLANVNARSGRVGSEGRVVAFETGNKITLVEVNCQTDFVANSEGFGNFAIQTALLLGQTDLFGFVGEFDQIGASQSVDGTRVSLEDLRKETSAKTGENIVIRRWAVEEVASENATVASYVHSNNKIGVAVSFEASDPKVLSMPIVKEMMGNVAMQIAAMNPLGVARLSVPLQDIERQRAIFETQLREANKPKAAWEKIIEGKFNKWYSEVCLLDQESVLVAKKSVGTVVAELGKELGCELKVLNFVRLQVGEGIEKKVENLAEAVAAAIGA